MFPLRQEQFDADFSWGLKGLGILFGILALLLVADLIWGAKVEHRDEQRIKIYGSLDACGKEQRAEDCAKAFADAQQQHAQTAPRFAGREACEAQYGDGGCVVHSNGGTDWFVPVMLGFMLGHAVLPPPPANPYPAGSGEGWIWAMNQSAQRSAAGIVSQPVYVDRRGMAYAAGNPVGQYRTACMINTADPSCPPQNSSISTGSYTGGSHSSGGFVYFSSGGSGSGGAPASSSVWSSKSYAVEHVRTTVTRGGFGTSASSAPTVSTHAATATSASSSSSVARGGFGSTAAAHASAGS